MKCAFASYPWNGNASMSTKFPFGREEADSFVYLITSYIEFFQFCSQIREVFPTPQHADELGRVGRKVEAIQLLVARFVLLNQEMTTERSKRDQVPPETTILTKDTNE